MRLAPLFLSFLHMKCKKGETIMSITTKKTKSIIYIHYLIVALLIFGFQFLPAPAPLTPMGMPLLGVFFGAIYGWSFIGILWPSILAILQMGLTLGMPTVLSSGLGSSITWMVVFTYIVMAVLDENKILDVLAAFLLTRKFSEGKPWLTFVLIIFASFLCGTIGGFASLILFLTLVFKIAENVNETPYGKFAVSSALGILIGHLFGMIVFPFFGNAIIFINIWTPMSGEAINYTSYMICSISTSIVGLVIYLLVCRFILRLDLSPLANFDAKAMGFDVIKLSRRQKMSIVLILFMFFNLLAPTIFPSEWIIIQILSNLTTFGQVAIPVVLFMIISDQGSPIVDFRKCSKYVSWDVILICGTVLPLASTLTGDGTGVSEFIVQLIQPLTGLGLNAFVFLLIIMFIAACVTNVANNTVVAIIVMPIIIAFSKIDNTLSLSAGFFIMTFMTHLAFLTPSAAPYAAITYANENWISIKSAMKYGLPIFAALFVGIFLYGYIIAKTVL